MRDFPVVAFLAQLLMNPKELVLAEDVHPR
jgi:hypothetical protein